MTTKWIEPISEQNASYRLTCLMMDLADAFAAFPEVKVDPRAWQHLMVYAPKDASGASDVFGAPKVGSTNTDCSLSPGSPQTGDEGEGQSPNGVQEGAK